MSVIGDARADEGRACGSSGSGSHGWAKVRIHGRKQASTGDVQAGRALQVARALGFSKSTVVKWTPAIVALDGRDEDGE